MDIPTSVRLRVESDEDVSTISTIPSELDGVVHIDAYFGSLDFYPAWNYEGRMTVETGIVTTNAIIGPVASP